MKTKFSRQLRLWRTGQKITQSDAAFILQVNPRTYTNWEQGRNNPPAYASNLISSTITNKPKE